MVHLLRSLFLGYFLAITVGTVTLAFGASPLVVLLGVWLGGSVLSIGIAATMPVLPDAVEPVFVPIAPRMDLEADGPMKSTLTARELAKWDSDLAAEQFEADLAADLEADLEADLADGAADADAVDRKTG